MKKIYLIVSIALVLLTFNKAKSQNLTNYNLYAVNPVLYNPAYAIDDSKIRAFVNTHLQWVGFDGAPRANTFGFYTSCMKNMGFGLSVFNNKQGITNYTNLSLTYAYRAKFSEGHYLTFGVSGGYMMDKLKTGDIMNADLTDPTIVNNTYKQNAFSARAGLVYFNRGFEASVAAPQLVNAGKSSGYIVSMFSYNFKLDEAWSLKPILQYRDVKTSPAQFDGSFMASWKNILWAQFGYRSNQSYLMCFGVNCKGLEIAYAYQMEAGDISTVGTSHEIQLSYRFGNGPNTAKYGKTKSMLPSAGTVHDTIYVMPLSENTKVVGTLVRKSDSKPVAGTITITENGNIIQKIASTNGIFSIDLKSGKTYKVEASSNSFPTTSQTIEIPKKTVLKEVNITVDYIQTAKVTVVDAETKRALKTTINVTRNGIFDQVINADSNYTINLEPGAVYEFDYKSHGYYSKKVTVDLTTQDLTNQNIELTKIKKEAFTLGQINFETNSSTITLASLPILDNFIKILQDNPTMKFEIAGHSDNVGNAAANLILSQARAQSCVDYMVSKGIAASRLTPKGYGDTKPLVPNTTPENLAKNRRVEAKIIQ